MDTLLAKSKSFALDIIFLYRFLCGNGKEYIMSGQLLLNGASIGLSIREAQAVGADMAVALRKANRALYWLDLLYESKYISERDYNSAHTECEALIELLQKFNNTEK